MEICDFLKSWKRMCNSMTEMNGCEDCQIVRNTRGARCGDMPCEIQDVESIAREVEKWAAEHPEPVYPTWFEVLERFGVAGRASGEPYYAMDREIYLKQPAFTPRAFEPIPADIAEKLGVERRANRMIFGLTKKKLEEERAEFDRKLRDTERWADELQESLDKKIRDIGEQDAEIEKLKTKIDNISQSLREAKEENEELRMQIAVLHKYYFEGREPSEAEIYDIRRA